LPSTDSAAGAVCNPTNESRSSSITASGTQEGESADGAGQLT
jgi:hypothetical protein